MYRCLQSALLITLATFGLCAHARGQAPTAPAQTNAAAAVPVVLPQAYDLTISSLSALATGAAAALKTNKSDARTLAIRVALSKRVLAAGPMISTITLDKTDTDASLGEIAILCAPRQNYVNNGVALNYLNALVQNLNAVSAKPAAPTDIAGALKLMLATSSYSVTDQVKVDPATIAAVAATKLSNCKADLSAYAKDYYGTDMPAANPTPGAAAAVASPAAAGGGIDTFSFLGPIGTLIDTFLSILQPVLIDASQIVDEDRRRAAIETALADPAIHAKIETTGHQLASAVDSFAAASRHSLVGSFVEQLVSIRKTSIDLSNEADCKTLSPATRLPSGAPNAAFIDCWRAAWAKLQPQVSNLNTIGDSYDTLADATTVSAQKLFGTIMADYAEISTGAPDAQNLAIFGNDITEFITLANAVATAASSSNISALKSAIAAVAK